jgi:hypothetical protein
MFARTTSNLRLLGGAIATNLLLAVVVGIGMTVRPVNAGMLLPARPAGVAAVPLAGAVPGQEVILAAGGQLSPGVGGTAAAGAVNRSRSGARATSTERVRGVGSSTALAGTAPGQPSRPTVTRPAPRVEPSKAALQAAVRELDARTNYFRPTENQVREFSGQVCTGFDQGYSFEQVKSAVLDSAKRAPYLGVSSADADYATRSSVRLFCPGYAPLLP